ncbi:hypothetical protein [Streptomyces sp. NPDC090080]|uniref:hypothetical protein n=1 Tax=Streptomyces sp. NPDC090080 TaxID=3365939 RepID=UPI0037F58F84
MRTGVGLWGVVEVEVRQAAAYLNAVAMDEQDLVRVGPFRRMPVQERDSDTPLRWRQRIAHEVQGSGSRSRAVQGEGGRPFLLAGVDWRQLLVEQTREGAQPAWWLPRAVVRLLDAAEHAETRWVHAARNGQTATTPPGTTADLPRPRPAGGRQTSSPETHPVSLRPYTKELEGQLYSVLSRKPDTSSKVAGWLCAVCGTAPATVLDHCHEHGYIRAPFSELPVRHEGAR